jgi:DNA-binding NtrC family response regulator
MKARTLIVLTNDTEFEGTARGSAEAGGYRVIIGREPKDAARLFGQHLDEIDAVVMDLDHCEHGAAWLGAFTNLQRKIPALAVSRLDRRFLAPLAHRHGAEHWASKPINLQTLTALLQAICQ